MALLHFPSALTEEEENLKQALIKLKKKKKMLQSLKSASNNQEKETTHNKNAAKQAPPPSIKSAGKATEQAKKLVKAGAIKVAELKKSGFKRSKNLEKKLKETEKSATAPPVGFQPFNAYSTEDEDDKQPTSKRLKGLSESFVSSGFNNRDFGKDRERDRDHNERPEREYREPPKKGNTVYVHGIGITEEMLRKFFATFGNIVNITMEMDRNNSFITFEKMESADKAIAEANGASVNNIQLRVQMARRQRPLDSMVDGASSTSSWSTIAASNSQKGTSGNQKGSRRLMTYDAGDLFD